MKFHAKKNIVPSYEPGVTFKTKVEQFWEWFPSAARRLEDGFDQGNISSEETQRLVGPALNELISGVCWCFGPAMDKVGHHLALSPEGNENTLMLAMYWVKRAPAFPVWEFYPAKPGSAVGGGSLGMFDRSFVFSEMSAALTPDQDNQKARIAIYHPSFSELDEKQRIIAAFISLDELLGELGTENWLSHVEARAEPLADSFPLSELDDKLRHFYQVMEWEMQRPAECWYNYSFKSPDSELPFPQVDSYTKGSRFPGFVRDYFNAPETYEDPMVKEGAAMVYLAIPSEWFPEENAVHARGEVEDAVGEALEANQSGTLAGGGMGTEYGYCDFLVFDGNNSIETISKTARAFNLPSGAHVGFFDSTLRSVRFPVG